MATKQVPSIFGSGWAPYERQWRLRVGAVLESLHPAAWIVAALRDIRLCDCLELILLVQQGGPCIATAKWSGSLNLFTRLWSRLDRRIYKPTQDAFAPITINPSEYTSEVLFFNAVDSTLVPEDIQRIKSVRLDVIVNFGSLTPNSNMGEAATSGMWGFDLSEDGCATNSPRFDLERFREGGRQGVIATELRVESGVGRGKLVGRTFSRADSVSPTRGENFAYWRRSGLLLKQLTALREPGMTVAMNGSEFDSPSHQRTSCGVLISAGILARAATSALIRAARRKVQREQWFIAVRERTASANPFHDLRGFYLIRPQHDRFYADPFLIEEAGRNYIFFEDYRYATAKGLISYIALDERGHWNNAKVVLETPYHLSYPFLFRHQGEIFMMPETSAARRIEVFRAVEFPERWERHATLIDDIVAFDPTLLHHNGKFWLFVSGVTNHDGENHDLSLYWAEDVFGKWYPHPENPVVSDVRRARPAGALFLSDGHLYRPGQNSAHAYGRAITINRVEELTTRKYRETPVGCIEPDWLPGNIGTHSINQNERFQVIDGRFFSKR